MNIWKAAGAAAVVCLLAGSASLAAAGGATMFRIFLKDGTSLVSFGEVTRVGDRVVFSMPTGSAPDAPLELVNIAADRVDWPHTDRYATSARAAHYIETQAESDYIALSNEVLQTLNNVVRIDDPAKRLASVELVRKKIATWPQSHYNYRDGEVRQLLGMLDEAIADLRAANGDNKFSLDLVAFSAAPPVSEPMLPAPGPREAIEQVLEAARLSDVPADRSALLKSALASLDREGASLDASWVGSARASTAAALAAETAIDARYRSLSDETLRLADRRAAAADVRGLQRLLARIGERDKALGAARPDAVAALVAAVDAKLDGARRLRLALDRWSLRAPIFAEYRIAIRTPIGLFVQLQPLLEDIKSLAGSTPAALATIERLVDRIVDLVAAISPPQEVESSQALFVNAAHLAQNAARIRRDATLSNNIAHAWDASAAAAGALMLGERARTEIQTSLRPPRLR
jgi:hypothetical protein